MAFRLKDDETIAHAIKRMAVEQIDDAVAQLKGGASSRVEGVHEARKCVKKIRSLLRLVRPGLGDEVYAAENAAYRDVGQMLGPVRDADVLIATLDGLKSKKQTKRVQRAATELRERLMTHRRRVVQELLTEQHVAESAMSALTTARARVDGWHIAGDEWSTLGVGLRRTYARGRTAYGDAFNDPVPERFHEWRKRAKDLTYHVRVLRPLWPDIMETWGAQTDELGELLGTHHDLSVLEAALNGELHDASGSKDLRTLATTIDERRSRVEQQARPLGRRLYAERPKAFVRRLEEYWRVIPNHA